MRSEATSRVASRSDDGPRVPAVAAAACLVIDAVLLAGVVAAARIADDVRIFLWRAVPSVVDSCGSITLRAIAAPLVIAIAVTFLSHQWDGPDRQR